MSVTIRKRKLADGSQALYLDIYSLGRRRQEFLHLKLAKNREKNREILATAEEIRAQRQIELSRTEHALPRKQLKGADFLSYFEKFAKGRNRSYQSVIVHLQTFAGNQLLFSELSPARLEAFQHFLLNTVTENSARTYFNKIKAALSQAVKDHIINENPSLFVKSLRKITPERVFLTVEELQKLAATECMNEEVRKAFFFSCYTGLRLSDVKQLRWKNIVSGRMHFEQKKTSQREYLPLSDFAQSIMGKEGRSDNLVFELPPSENTIWYAVKKWAKAAQIKKDISFHTSRHTFATLALSNGIDIYTVSKLLGHTNIQHTQIYAKIIDRKKMEAVNKLPEVVLW